MTAGDPSPLEPPSAERAAARAVEETIRAIPSSQPLDAEDETDVRHLAATAASSLLDTLSEIYDLAEWDWEVFEAAYLRGALRAWRPDSSIRRHGADVEVSSTTCPLLEAAERDPAICERCRLVHEMAARQAAPTPVRSVDVPERITEGDPECRFVFHLEPGSSPPESPVVLDARGERLGILTSKRGPDRSFEVLLDPEARRSAGTDSPRLAVPKRRVLALRREEIVIDATLEGLRSRTPHLSDPPPAHLAQEAES